MDESLQRLRGAAQAGDIDALYAVIQDDADVFQRIDQMKFVDTPLHIAAATGHTDFAMEIMNLNPSFARKLNQWGQSPIHLALQNQQDEMVIDLLSVDKDLVRVKGREGYTAFHVVAKDGNVPLLSQFLEQCPDCISDLTIRKETALHIAARNNRLEAFKAILHFIQRGTIFDFPYKIQKKRILNSQDKDGDTVLHIAASNNQPQMVKLLIKCKESDRNMVNGRGLTALDVLLRQTQVDGMCLNILSNAKYSFLKCFEESRFRRNVARDLTEMKLETINVLLVVFVLILTITYQALLSPPRGLLQGDVDSKNVGRSVMDSFVFLLFFIPNGTTFLMAWSITLTLLSVVAKSIMLFVFPLYLLIWFGYIAAVYAIAPTGFSGWIAGSVPSIFIVLIHHLVFYSFKNKMD